MHFIFFLEDFEFTIDVQVVASYLVENSVSGSGCENLNTHLEHASTPVFHLMHCLSQGHYHMC
jgi:hypothetical protein